MNSVDRVRFRGLIVGCAYLDCPQLPLPPSAYRTNDLWSLWVWGVKPPSCKRIFCLVGKIEGGGNCMKDSPQIRSPDSQQPSESDEGGAPKGRADSHALPRLTLTCAGESRKGRIGGHADRTVSFRLSVIGTNVLQSGDQRLAWPRTYLNEDNAYRPRKKKYHAENKTTATSAQRFSGPVFPLRCRLTATIIIISLSLLWREQSVPSFISYPVRGFSF